MGSVFKRFLLIAVGAAAVLVTTTSQAQMIRMDALAATLGARSLEPFGRSTDLAPAGPLWIKWRSFESDFTKADAEIARCRAEPGTCSGAAEWMVALIDEARGLEGRRQFAAVNRAINLSVAYASDLSQHGVNDLWSGPLTTLSLGRGDCEDYAIAKMFALRAAGVPASDLRLLIAHNHSDGDAHAVLAARHDGRWLILDNRRMMLVDDEHARDLQPLFSLDLAGVRQFGAPALLAATPAQATPASSTMSASSSDLLPLLM
jgi:predicted transglutaminase-like cysteine proteinase